MKPQRSNFPDVPLGMVEVWTDAAWERVTAEAGFTADSVPTDWFPWPSTDPADYEFVPIETADPNRLA